MTPKPKPPTASSLRERFINKALEHTGYYTNNGMENVFAQGLNINGKPWNGLFIDVVASEAGVRLPVAHTVSTVALAYYLGQLPKQPQTPNGVYVRTRHQTEVIGYARPKYKTASPLSPNENAPVITPAQVRAGIKHKSVVLVQLALSKVTGIKGLPRGHFDTKTKLAYAKFQRDIGYVGISASGDADYNSLKLLGELTGFFNAKP